MAALTATDWSVEVEHRSIEGSKRHNRVKLTLATAGSYPSNGIPIPSASALGMTYNLDYITLFDEHSASVNPVKYDHTNGTIRVYVATATAGPSLTELATTVTVGAGGTFVLYLSAVGY
jgi:hypothetical protein